MSISLETLKKSTSASAVSQQKAKDCLLREPEVLKLAGFSRATLYREIKAGRWPAPVKITPHMNGWPEADIQRAVHARVAARDSRALLKRR